jgi:lipopolysaccharide/colanic/teichoic acid biosynthesis glycosyltransferase
VLRALDIIFSALALVVLSPLFLVVALILRFSGEGEVFYAQQRVGKNGKFFTLLKFATMLKDSPNMGTGTVTLKDDPRVLPIGRALRKSKINELPQLVNILKGDMSLVGPRPQTERCLSGYPAELKAVLLTVPPGLSGVGSIVFRGEEDFLAGQAASMDFYDNVIAPYKCRVEAWYVTHRTLTTYLKAIALTVYVVLIPESSIVWKVFEKLPAPPDALKTALHYPG